MSDTARVTRYCLRDLPLPAKIVVTCFLLAVGIGYFAALVQMHFQDSKSGEAMPTIDDIVLKFTGKKKMTGPPPEPVSTFVRLITAPEEGPPFNGSGTMAPAFTSKSPDFIREVRVAEDSRDRLRAERTGERDALVLWAKTAAKLRQKAYADDHFGLAAEEMPKAITAKFKSVDGTAVKVKSIIDTRCVRCHREGGDDPRAELIPLDSYANLDRYLQPVAVAAANGWVRVQEPMNLTRLTQSTHAHLLSFAVLFSLTGLAFAFTSYATSVRCVIAPLALVAIVADVGMWWLARLSDGYGVYFAMAVVFTGGLAGLGAAAQIVLSLWNMYGPKGKLVILLLFVIGGATGWVVFQNVMMPGMEARKQGDAGAGNNGGDAAKPPVAPDAKFSKFEKALQIKGADGKERPVLDIPFKKEPEFNMVRALFDQDSDEFAGAVKAKDQQTIDALMPERHGELRGLLAWRKLPDAERKRTFDADAFDLPADAKQVTANYLKDGKLKIQTLITDRCIRCHGGDVNEKSVFDSYETLRKFLELPK